MYSHKCNVLPDRGTTEGTTQGSVKLDFWIYQINSNNLFFVRVKERFRLMDALIDVNSTTLMH